MAKTFEKRDALVTYGAPLLRRATEKSGQRFHSDRAIDLFHSLLGNVSLAAKADERNAAMLSTIDGLSQLYDSRIRCVTLQESSAQGREFGYIGTESVASRIDSCESALRELAVCLPDNRFSVRLRKLLFQKSLFEEIAGATLRSILLQVNESYTSAQIGFEREVRSGRTLDDKCGKVSSP